MYKEWDEQNNRRRTKEEIFFSNRAITILSLFTYSVSDEKVKIGWRLKFFEE